MNVKDVLLQTEVILTLEPTSEELETEAVRLVRYRFHGIKDGKDEVMEEGEGAGYELAEELREDREELKKERELLEKDREEFSQTFLALKEREELMKKERELPLKERELMLKEKEALRLER
ncbi:uncharacterized protein LOC131234620 [Magnolia sinica]|uniref:uncharacterized protein LOC131234620 n=1 Tax=Magnolia sinica TaxID=86752 RepID=UPI0026594530|nr:uncharacterized protein LOC131234620 [Magnolia sinica]